MMKRGRKETFENAKAFAAVLKDTEKLNMLSRYLTLKLVNKGYMEAKTVKGEGRGRPRVEYVVTGKGRGLVALAANWK